MKIRSLATTLWCIRILEAHRVIGSAGAGKSAACDVVPFRQKLCSFILFLNDIYHARTAGWVGVEVTCDVNGRLLAAPSSDWHVVQLIALSNISRHFSHAFRYFCQ